MTLIKSISGIRGTIGGGAGEGLNPLDIVKFTSAYATLIRKTCTVKSNKIVVGRDARISGEMVKNVVVGTLMGMGWDVVDIDLASTPTTELAVTMEGASGGIILTASHNPKQWNALKLLNEKGEFLNAAEGQEVLRIAAAEEFDYAEVDQLGSYRQDLSYNQKHIDSVLALDLVDVEAIRKANFRVAIDCVNSVGGIILPQLLEQLGVQHVEKLYCEPTGNFQHNPEPLEKNLGDVLKMTYAQVAELVDAHVSGACVERHAGSSPVLGTLLLKKGESSHAEIAQLVEHNLAKVRVASSSLVFRSFQIKKSRKHCSVLAGFFCCMEVVVTVSVMRIRASFRRSCWPASRYSSEWSCCFCWRGRLSVSVACPIRTAGP